MNIQKLTAFFLMAACFSSFAEMPQPKKTGHLLAAYCIALPEKKTEKITALYREIIPISAPEGSYTTVSFSGGYVGLTGNKDGRTGTTINFSIWGADAEPTAPADTKHGIIKTRQFTHEGVGWAGRLAYPWKIGTRYHVFVHVQHENGKTIYSAWFGDASKNEWLLAGRIKRSGTSYLGHAGGFLEHAGKENMRAPRKTGYGAAWVHNGSTWIPCTHAEASVRDPANARFYKLVNVVYLELGLGRKSEEGMKRVYSLDPVSNIPPSLPEEVPVEHPM